MSGAEPTSTKLQSLSGSRSHALGNTDDVSLPLAFDRSIIVMDSCKNSEGRYTGRQISKISIEQPPRANKLRLALDNS